MEDEKVLLKLKRQYSESEAVKALSDEITKLKFRIGELTSENAEVLHDNKILKLKLESATKKAPKPKKFSVEGDAMRAAKKLASDRLIKLKKCEQDLNLWRNKAIALEHGKIKNNI